MTNNTDGAALLPVTPEARKAALDLMDEVGRVRADLYGPAILRGEWDECDELQAFARFERDTIERHRQSSSNAGGVDERAVRWIKHNLRLAEQMMKSSADQGNGYANFAAHDAHHALSVALASLSTSTAEPPSPCPGDGDGLTDSLETWGQRVTAWIDEFGYDALERELCASRNTLMIWTMGRSMPRPFARQGLIRTINEYRAALTTPPTPDRIGKDAVREALEQNRGPLADAARQIAVRFGVGGEGQASAYAAAKDAILAALAHPAQATPSALSGDAGEIPRVPTEAMCAMGDMHMQDCSHDAASVWAAMVSALPSHQGAGEP